MILNLMAFVSLIFPAFVVLNEFLPAWLFVPVMTLLELFVVPALPTVVTIVLYVILYVWGLIIIVMEFPMWILILYLLSLVPLYFAIRPGRRY